MLPIIGKWNKQDNEKPFPHGLRLASNQWRKERKDDRETVSLRIKNCFQLLAKALKEERETFCLWIKTCFQSMDKRT